MATSGILLLTKTKEANKILQHQFINRTIKKRYVALLDGSLAENSGKINLPLRVDLDDRPKQLVDFTHGKPAETNWKTIYKENGKTRVHFYPITGRTHQLRMHAAHKDGLNTPIVGDDLYGTKENRLHLHAEFIEFLHPTTAKKMSFTVAAAF
jgi:tRNA pseudouridine32 synthase/23S rRNA pseudouridine746 synthase